MQLIWPPLPPTPTSTPESLKNKNISSIPTTTKTTPTKTTTTTSTGTAATKVIVEEMDNFIDKNDADKNDIDTKDVYELQNLLPIIEVRKIWIYLSNIHFNCGDMIKFI